MDSKIGFEVSLIVVEAVCLRGRCASFIILTTTVSEIFGGQTNSYILAVLAYQSCNRRKKKKKKKLYLSMACTIT